MYCSVVGYTVTEDDGLGRNGVIERVNVAVYFLVLVLTTYCVGLVHVTIYARRV